MGRFHSIPGDALSVDFVAGYDLALVTNFLPDLGSTEGLLRRIRASLVEGGRVALFELMLNYDEISPPAAVELNLALLATTPSGEARAPRQLTNAFERAGFQCSEPGGDRASIISLHECDAGPVSLLDEPGRP